MKYHIEGEISRITLKGGRRDVSIRLQPSPEYIRKDGDLEKVLCVGGEASAQVRYALKDDLEKLDIKIPRWWRLFDLLMACKTNRERIRLEFEEEDGSQGDFKFEKVVGVSAL